jgi:hypothetical protein
VSYSKFAERIDAYVTAAVGRGVHISSADGDAACPLGCVPGAVNIRPPTTSGCPVVAGESDRERNLFAVAFDGLPAVDPDSPFARLGAEYRRRFP